MTIFYTQGRILINKGFYFKMMGKNGCGPKCSQNTQIRPTCFFFSTLFLNNKLKMISHDPILSKIDTEKIKIPFCII